MVMSKDEPGFRQCAVTVMDNIADPDITFDGDGICNYYYQYNDLVQQLLYTG